MKKGLQLLLVIILFIQQLGTLPLSVIAEDWSSDSGIAVSDVVLTDSEGEMIESVQNNSELNVQLKWRSASSGESERIITFPEQVRANPGTYDLFSGSNEKAGEYILSESDVTLKTDGSYSGQLTFSVDISSSQDGEQTIIFFSEQDKWSVDLSIIHSSDELDDVDSDESIESNEDSDHDEEMEAEDTEDTEELEETYSEFSASSEAENESEELGLEEKSADSEGAELDSAIEEQLQFSNVTFSDSNGVEYSADNPFDLDASPIGRLDFDWFLIEGHTITAGDTYRFQLPDEFRPVSGTSGLLGDVGTWTVNVAGVVTFSFNEAVDGDEVNGSFWFEVSLDEDALSEAIEQEITFDLVPEYTVSFPVTPKNSGLIDKEGTINNEGFNSTQAFWTIDINTALSDLVNSTVTDTLPEFMSYDVDSLEIIQLNMTPQGNRIEADSLSSDLYTFSVEEGQLLIDLSGLNEYQLKEAYRIRYTTNIDESEQGFDGAQTFTNKAVLSTDGNSYDATSTVSSGYGLAIEKISPEYNWQEQSFDWTINYNFNEKLIDQSSAFLEDTWSPAGEMRLLAESLSVYEVTIDENGQSSVSSTPIDSDLYDLTINNDDSGFTLQFNDRIDRQAYQIRYTTRLLGDQGAGIIDTGGSVSNTVSTGTDQSDGSSGSWGQESLRKNHIRTDIGAKRIDWRMRINRNSYVMENLVLTDTFEGDGLSLIKDDSTHSGFNLFLLEEDGTEFTGYTIEYTEPQTGQPGKFVLTFTETIDRPLTLTYSTRFERNSDGSATYANRGIIEWETDGNNYSSDSNRVPSGNTGLTSVNGVKNGRYNAVTQEITWSVHTNYARLPLEDDFEIIDELPAHQEWLEDSFDVFQYEVSANGSIINEESLDKDLYTLEFIQDDEEAFRLSLDESLIGEEMAVGVRFKTQFTDGWIRDAQVKNTAQVTNDKETLSLEASVKIPFGGVFADKNGVQTGEFSERIDWEISLNPNKSVVSDYKLTDVPDLNSQLLPETFVLYEAYVNEEGELSKTDTILTDGEDYNLTITINQETGEESFELTFPDEINQAYILTYSSFIDPLVSRDEAISNSFTVEGTTTEFKELTEVEVNVFKSNAGGGDGSSVRGNLLLRKVNPRGDDLSGAEMQLFTRNGQQLLRSGITDSDGQVQFSGLRRGTYLLKEVTAPDRYVISEELAEGIELTLNHEADQEIVEYEAVNRRTQVSISKESPDGRIESDVVFSILDEHQQPIIETVTAENGHLIIEDLDPGNYYLKEIEAPDGYILNTDLVPFAIEINDDGTQTVPELTVVNYLGSVSWQKTDGEGQALSGVTFEVLDADNEVVQSVQSDADGNVLVTDLSPGDYTVRETKAANGFIKDTRIQNFTIEAEQAGEPETLNLNSWSNYQGSVRLFKVDSNENLLEGATFELRDENGLVVAEKMTDENGEITVTGLEPGEYTFAETASPDGFIKNTETITFTVSSESEGEPELIVLDDFINYKGSAELIKKTEAGETLEGALFELRDAEGHLIRGNLHSDEAGRVYVEDLAPGEYVFNEIEAPAGYILNTEGDFSFTIDAVFSGKLPMVEVGELINYQGSAELVKTDSLGNPLADAVFELRDSDGTLLNDELRSDQDGKVVISDLAPGSYSLTETQAPTGFLLNLETISFTVEDEMAGQPETIHLDDFINYQARFSFDKVDEEGTPLSDAVFELYTVEGELVDTLTSTSDGVVMSDALAPGDYLLYETTAPDGYMRNEQVIEITVSNEAEGEPEQIELDPFVNYQASASFVKTDADGDALESAEFALFKDGEVVQDKILSDEYGEVVLSDLSPGKYELKETVALDGFILNTDVITFTVPNSHEGPLDKIELDGFVNYKGAVRLYKVNDSGQPLEGAVFDLLSDGEVLSTHTTNDKGQLTVSNLSPGSYTFIETASPEGYAINTLPIDFVIEAKHAGEPELIVLDDFINFQGQAFIQKVDSQGEPLEGAVFDLRDSEGNLIRESVVSDQEGYVMVDQLAPGDYRFIETQAPEGYLLNTEETDYFTIEFENDGELPSVDAGKVTNYQASALWHKTDTNGHALEGAVFQLTDENGDVILDRLVSDDNGLVLAENLAPGSYTLSETQAPEGYILNTDVLLFEIKNQSAGKPETIDLGEWLNYQGMLEVIKKDNYDTLLEGAVFDLIDSNNQVVHTDLTTDSEGRIIVEGLAPGDYYLVETQAPVGYILEESPVSLTVPAEFRGKPERLSVQVINEEIAEGEEYPDNQDPDEESSGEMPSNEDPESTGMLPQTSVSKFTLLTRVAGLAVVTFGLYILTKDKEKE